MESITTYTFHALPAQVSRSIFPRSDRSPTMVPHRAADIRAALGGKGHLAEGTRIKSGFYISQAFIFQGGRA